MIEVKDGMKDTIRKFLKPFVPQIYFSLLKRRKERKLLVEWRKNGCPVPSPHIVKQNAIKEYQQKYGYTILVETGTFMGYMVEAQKKRFKKIISIELGFDLFERASEKFCHDKNVIIIHGDSGKVLPVILKDINEPILFWLDGHYSEGETAKGDKDCPIFEELDAILEGKKFNHVLLIDDARLFTGSGDYPTIEELTEFVRGKNNKYRVEVKHDIIRCIV